jgi:hypothetical protein
LQKLDAKQATALYVQYPLLKTSLRINDESFMFYSKNKNHFCVKIFQAGLYRMIINDLIVVAVRYTLGAPLQAYPSSSRWSLLYLHNLFLTDEFLPRLSGITAIRVGSRRVVAGQDYYGEYFA